MADDLRLGGQAVDALAGYGALSRQPAQWVVPDGSVAVDVRAVARDRVDVDLSPLGIDTFEAHRRPTPGARVAERGQLPLDQGDTLEPHDDVEVVVRPRLTPDERVDAPATVEPDGQPG